MIFFFDESVDGQIAERFRQDGHVVFCVWEMEPGIPDDQVLDQANEQGAILVTADKDFGELVFRQGRVTSGVVLVRLAGLSPETKADVVATAVWDYGEEMSGAFTVVAPGHIRIRRSH